MDKEKMWDIRNELRTIIPSSYRWSLRANKKHKVELFIRKAPDDLHKYFDTTGREYPFQSIITYPDHNFSEYKKLPMTVLKIFLEIQRALNRGNEFKYFDEYDGYKHWNPGYSYYPIILIGSPKEPFQNNWLKK